MADEPLIHATDRGMLARLRMATIDYAPLNDNHVREVIEWHTILLSGELAERVDRDVNIGTPIEIHGRLRSRKWTDRKGVQHDTAEVAASHLEVLEQIEGYSLPKQILERIPIKRERRQVPTEVSAPASDPDNLPF